MVGCNMGTVCGLKIHGNVIVYDPNAPLVLSGRDHGDFCASSIDALVFGMIDNCLFNRGLARWILAVWIDKSRRPFESGDETLCNVRHVG